MEYKTDKRGTQDKAKASHGNETKAFDMTWYGVLVDKYYARNVTIAAKPHDYKFIAVDEGIVDSEEPESEELEIPSGSEDTENYDN